MHTRIVRKGNPEWVPTGEAEDEELLHGGDLLAQIFRTAQTDPKRQYRWDAWAENEAKTGCGYAETRELAKEYAQQWLHEQGEL
jgi:hypothetical protein